MNAASPIRVLVVDDSALMRKLLSDIINTQPDMRAIGSAPDPLAAREMVRNLTPDVITLDVEMPKMDGLEFLSRLMRLKPTPVVMISTLTEEGADATLKALELGAVDFLAKPKLEGGANLRDYAALIADKIRAAARSRPRARTAEPVVQRMPLASRGMASGIIAIGASTGGTEALRELLQRFPEDAPGVVVTQHMPPGFTRRFAERLDTQCPPTVREAAGNEKVVPGTVYIAPGDRHLAIKRVGADYVTVLLDTAPVNRHRPSVDVLFGSVAEQAGAGALGVILTGMGRDGAAGMLAMHRAGAHTFAQDEASCVVFGMPREAIAQGAVDEVVPLDAMAEQVFNRLRTHPLQRQQARTGVLAK